MAFDAFLKLDGTKGESKDHKHKDEIDIESYSWGMNPTGAHGSGGGGGAGKVGVHDIPITKDVDKSSPLLALRGADGTHIKEGLLTVRKAGEHPLEYIKIKLTDILISSVQGSDLGDQVSLNFAKVQIEYQEQGADGKVKGGPVGTGWDIKANQKI